jgi:hypothetical protein
MSLATEELPATMTDEFYVQHQPEAARVASVEWKGSTIFAADDLEQAIWEHAIVNWKHYAGASADNVSKFMTRAARKFAVDERTKHMYATGAFIYTPSITRAYLETCAWEPLEEVPDVDARVDLIEAFTLLRKSAPKQAAAVFKRYGLNEDGLSSSEQMNVSRGVEAICHRLNTGLRLSSESIDTAISKGD